MNKSAPARLLCGPARIRSVAGFYSININHHGTTTFRRQDSSDSIGDKKTGHIEAGPNDGILFFNNVFPLKFHWLLRFSFLTRTLSTIGVDPAAIFKDAVSKDSSMQVTGLIPRLKDGGAFLRFSHAESIETSAVESMVHQYLKEKSIRPWWNPFQRVRARGVRGIPWLEDLYRPSSRRLKVEFVPPDSTSKDSIDLSQEMIYSIFRSYGKLLEITSQPADSKILPKYVTLDFASMQRAVMARNCLHGFRVLDESSGQAIAKLKISYERSTKAGWFKAWVMDHPRVVIPILAALTAAITVAVFDPIRTFFIKLHITRAFHLTENKIYKWFVKRTSGLFHAKPGDIAGLNAIFNERKEDIEQIQKWLLESTDTFIVVQGPRGSGKKELVIQQALKARPHKLVIDCKSIQEARSDGATINKTAEATGYWPVFSWMNSISGLVDLAAQGATGMKTGFSETLDSQLEKILNNTASALRDVGLEGRDKHDKDYTMNNDAYLESHPEKRPVVVIDNFLHRSQDSTVIYDKLAEWAARLTSANIAHVIFLTTDVAFSKSLGKASPDRVLRQVTLGDLPRTSAKNYVISHLNPEPDDLDFNGHVEKLTGLEEEMDLAQLDDAISHLGGRLTDLEFLSRRIKAGETPSQAVHEIIGQSASEVMKIYILGAESTERLWNSQQAWILIRELAKNEGKLRYNQIILSDVFKSAKNPDAILQALEQAELISIVSEGGRPSSIKPGKPVFLSAFRLLAEDRVLQARLNIAMLSEQMKTQSASIDKNCSELSMLAQLPKQPTELTDRIKWLLRNVQASQKDIEYCEAKAVELKQILQTEF